MALHRGLREAGDLPIRQRRLDAHFLGQAAQPGTEDDADLRLERRTVAYDRDRRLDALTQILVLGHGGFEVLGVGLTDPAPNLLLAARGKKP